jgi:hypothetical protein
MISTGTLDASARETFAQTGSAVGCDDDDGR